MSDLASDVTSLDILTNIDLLRNIRAPIETRRQAADYLAKNPNPVALPVIIRALEDPDFDIRKSALRACTQFKSPLSVDALIKVSQEGTFSEREDAIRILGEIKDRRALQAIADAHTYSDWMSIRSTAATALGKLNLPECVPPLLEGLQDFEAPVRANAAEALGDIGDERAIDPLLEALKKETGWNTRHLANALSKIGEIAMKPLVSELAHSESEQTVREIIADTLADIIVNMLHPEEYQTLVKLTVDILVAELPTRDDGIRSYVARSALTRMSGVVTDQLIQAFANSNQAIRDQVAYILGDSKDPTLNHKLINALGLANSQVAAGAARVLYFRDINPRDHGYTGSL